MFSNYGTVYNIDLDYSAWFPSRGIFYEESPGFPCREEQVIRLQGDFFAKASELPAGSIDFIYDRCSMIHFNVAAEETPHDGVYGAAKEALRLLKDGGIFVSASDIYNPALRTKWPSLLHSSGLTYPECIFRAIQSAGLRAIDAPDFYVEDFYKDSRNYLIPVPGAPYHKRLTPAFSQRSYLPAYHAFSQVQDLPMLLARFVFEKAR